MAIEPTTAHIAPLAVTMGEPAGIGPELILQIWKKREEYALPPFIVLGDETYLQNLSNLLAINVDVEQTNIDNVANVFSKALPVLPLSGNISGGPNKPSEQDGKLICESIEQSVALCLSGKASGVVTLPINKNELYKSGFQFPGHTEYLADLAERQLGEPFHPVMMLAGPDLRAIPVTIHIALNEVPQELTSELIAETGRIVAKDLQTKFGIAEPSIAVAGLNPHAGENGSMGHEDVEIVEPAINQLKSENINAFGPLPADTLFHERARKGYDAVLCMYHDQALIPAKTLAFDDSVNVTLGLPFIRTSPDHGTAYDIAGKGIANPTSLVAAILMANRMARASTNGIST